MAETIVDALRDPANLGALPAFRDLATWSAWLVFLEALYGLPMTPPELEVFQRHTARQAPRPGGYPEGVAVVGVQSGKSRVAGALAAFEAARARPEGGGELHAILVAQDHRGAIRTLGAYAREPFEASPVLQRLVPERAAGLRRLLRRVTQREDALTLTSGVVVASYPCRPAAVRGLRACVVVIDELAFFVATDGRPTDREMLRVARGRVATTGGKVIVLSSPYAETGALWELHRRHYGREDSLTLIWQASASAMNPTLGADYLDRMRDEDPDAFRSEVLGLFRAGISSLFDPEVLESAVDVGVRERMPEEAAR